jgi:hypothetical protein
MQRTEALSKKMHQILLTGLPENDTERRQAPAKTVIIACTHGHDVPGHASIGFEGIRLPRSVIRTSLAGKSRRQTPTLDTYAAAGGVAIQRFVGRNPPILAQ